MNTEDYYSELDKGEAEAKSNIAYYQEGEELMKEELKAELKRMHEQCHCLLNSQAELLIENSTLKRIIQEQKEEWGNQGEDRPLSIQEKIDAAVPHRIGSDFTAYETALKMVGAKHSKYGLVDLVNYLLVVIKKWEARVKELEEKQ